MRAVLLGLCVITILQITVALQPAFNLEQLLETTDDEDIFRALHQHARTKRRAPDVNAPAMAAVQRKRRDAAESGSTDSGSTVSGSTDSGSSDSGSSIVFNDPVINDEIEGSGGGSGEGPDDNFST